MRRALATIALGAALLTASSAGARCPVRMLVFSMLTPSAGTIPRDGALVAALMPAGGGREGVPQSVSLVRGQTTSPMRMETIAPGLFRLIPTAERLNGTYRIDGVVGSADVQFGRPGRPAPPAAPVLDHAERYEVAEGRTHRLEVRAHFEFPMPEDVVAILTYWGNDTAPAGFSRAVPMANEQIVFGARGRCDPEPDGTRAPPQGATTVRVALVDRLGQVSAISAPQPMD